MYIYIYFFIFIKNILFKLKKNIADFVIDRNFSVIILNYIFSHYITKNRKKYLLIRKNLMILIHIFFLEK